MYLPALSRLQLSKQSSGRLRVPIHLPIPLLSWQYTLVSSTRRYLLVCFLSLAWPLGFGFGAMEPHIHAYISVPSSPCKECLLPLFDKLVSQLSFHSIHVFETTTTATTTQNWYAASWPVCFGSHFAFWP